MHKLRLVLLLSVMGFSQASMAQSASSPGVVGGAYAGGGVNTPSSSESMLFMQLQQIQSELAQLRGMVEEQQEQIRRLQREGLDRYQDLDQRISAAASQSVSAGSQHSASEAPVAPVAPTNNTAAAAHTPQQSADPEQERLYYDAAFDLVKAKDFDRASQAFNAFLRKYPSSQYAANAQYWLGEISLAKGDFRGAAQAFGSVVQNYPKHSKVPDSLYKLADSEQRQGNTDKAQGILRQIISQYPDSSAAQLAKRQLKL
ncbi:tol-pal system protein YbgF [Azomonas agilis]|uniref:Cell division coordinator CpoB n=1 Tax=Azomonas agilis TaxID=116849 RepID=A0A562I254_9GAMM|nr:tol-pal system protein YbgF [Azomonas agilis]